MNCKDHYCTRSAPSLRSYILTQGNDMASTFLVNAPHPRDSQRYSSLTAGERCLDHCHCRRPNTILLTVAINITVSAGKSALCHATSSSHVRSAPHPSKRISDAFFIREPKARKRPPVVTAKGGRWSCRQNTSSDIHLQSMARDRSSIHHPPRPFFFCSLDSQAALLCCAKIGQGRFVVFSQDVVCHRR